MIPCKGCSLAKIQHLSLSSLIRVPYHHFTYDTMLRDSHCERPKIADGGHAILERPSLLRGLLLGDIGGKTLIVAAAAPSPPSHLSSPPEVATG
jgi:hypothetical protein